VATSSIDDDLDGSSLNARFGVEDVATLLLLLLVLKHQYLGDNESGARIIVTIDLIIFIVIHLAMDGHVLKSFHFSFFMESYVPSSLAIMVRLVGHS
jgi:hypothetical protein